MITLERLIVQRKIELQNTSEIIRKENLPEKIKNDLHITTGYEPLIGLGICVLAGLTAIGIKNVWNKKREIGKYIVSIPNRIKYFFFL